MAWDGHITHHIGNSGDQMAQVKFLLNAPESQGWSLDPKLIHVLDLERTPYQVKTRFENGLLICQTATPESLRVQVPWSLPGQDPVILGTSTLPTQTEPYLLVLELARGRLTELRHFFMDGPAIGNRQVPKGLLEAHRTFVKAVMNRNDIEQCAVLATRSLEQSMELARSHLRHVIHPEKTDLLVSKKLCIDVTGVSEADARLNWAIGHANACRIGPLWRELMPLENKIDWSAWDLPVSRVYDSGLKVHAGPLIDFSEAGLPTWLSHYDDITQLSRVVANYVFYVVKNLKSKVQVWHVVRRPAMGKVCGLSEEQQIKITVAAIQAVSQAAPDAKIVVDLTTPWAEWLSQDGFELGPLHLADTLARADHGVTGIGLELALGYPSPGSHRRELIDVSKMLDLYQLINLPLHLSLSMPSQLAATLTPQHPPLQGLIAADTRQWPSGCTEADQAELAMSVLRLASSKSIVESLTWSRLCDDQPGEFLHSGLFRADGQPKLLALELERVRQSRPNPFGN